MSAYLLLLASVALLALGWYVWSARALYNPDDESQGGGR